MNMSSEERYFSSVNGDLSVFEDLIIHTDSLDSSRIDRVLPIMQEEQVIATKYLNLLIRNLKDTFGLDCLNVLDVGTGSGVFGIYAAKFNSHITAIDICERALMFCDSNARLNNIDTKDSEYWQVIKSDAVKFAKTGYELVILNPPFTPTADNLRIAYHASGGFLGQDLFKQQLKRALDIWLRDGGVCSGVHMLHFDENDEPCIPIDKDCFRYKSLIQDKYSAFELIQKIYKPLIKSVSNKYLNQTIELYLQRCKLEAKGSFRLVYFEAVKHESDFKKMYSLQSNSISPCSNSMWTSRITLHKKILYNSPLQRDASKLEFDLTSNTCSNLIVGGAGILGIINSWLDECKALQANQAVVDFLIDVSPFSSSSIRDKILEQQVIINQNRQDQRDVARMFSSYRNLINNIQKEFKGLYNHPYFMTNKSHSGIQIGYISYCLSSGESPIERESPDLRPAVQKEYISELPITQVEVFKQKVYERVDHHAAKSIAEDFEKCHYDFHDGLSSLFDPDSRNSSVLLSIPLQTKNGAFLGGLWIFLCFAGNWSPDLDRLVYLLAKSLTHYYLQQRLSSIEGIALSALSKSARAAVFARNFSHITGSHVISNPEFRNSLAGYHYVHGLRRRLDETYSNFLRAENELFEYITQAPFRAEDLWAQGTKALADARDKLGTGDVFLENTRRFHEYLQGRFDFIARAIDDTQDPPEPVWFVRDLVEGFLRQTAYLDNLVADVGLRLDNMEFNVIIQDQAFCAQIDQPQAASEGRFDRQSADLTVEFKWENTISNRMTKSIYECDAMIALPGGLVAAHAFYSLLENIIRNSAKYGALKQQIKDSKDSKYMISIELKLPPLQKSNNNYFQLLIWDNYSSAVKIKKDGTPEDNIQPEEQTWSILNEKLKKTFVKPDGQPEMDDLGMMEMQACSKLLCRPDSDGKYIRSNDVPGSVPSCTQSQYNLRVLPPINIRLKPAYLKYALSVEMPILLGCLTDKTDQGDKTTSMSFYTDKEQILLERAPFLMVIDGDWLQELNADRKEELLSNNNLPNRTLVLSSSVKSQIHKRRVRACTNEGLYSSVFKTKANENEKENEKELILSLYRTWLQHWKRLPDGHKKWHLWVGLERQAQQVQEAWEKQAKEWFKFGSNPLIELMVKSYSSDQNKAFATDSINQIYEYFAHKKSSDPKHASPEQAMPTSKTSNNPYWENEMDSGISLKNALVFDNHGNCFEEAHKIEKSNSLQKSTRFYQKLSGSVSPDLFRMLSRPPQDKFSFCFFIYSLVEACLTNVVVVDERLAWSLVEGYGIDESNRNFAQDLLEHQKAGIFPVFRFRQGETPNAENAKADEDQSIGFYNSVHKDRLDECLGASKSTLQNEGISFAATANGSSSLGLITPSGSNPGEAGGFEILSDIKEADVILIHEGAMDILTDQMGVKWVGVDNVDKDEHSGQLQALYQLAPIIIRTSGRGRKSKLLGEHLPFIEFGQVSSSLLTARNKFALVRGLLGSVGSKRTDG